MIKVMFFGPVADRVGAKEERVEYQPGMYLQDLYAQMQKKYSAAFELVCFTAVNGKHTCDMTLSLVDNSEVVFMSKFSGG